MFAPPLKRSEKLVLSAPLRKHITMNYKADPTPYEADLVALDALREENINGPSIDNCLLCAVSWGHTREPG